MIANPQENLINDYVPLFIGISQAGDVYPGDQIISGMTPLPSQMAIGATSDSRLAEESGILLGKELAELGFNLVMNPSLDVLEGPIPKEKENIGVQTFGGDPYWVGEMGKEFVSGLHIGGAGRLAVSRRIFRDVEDPTDQQKKKSLRSENRWND